MLVRLTDVQQSHEWAKPGKVQETVDDVKSEGLGVDISRQPLEVEKKTHRNWCCGLEPAAAVKVGLQDGGVSHAVRTKAGLLGKTHPTADGEVKREGVPGRKKEILKAMKRLLCRNRRTSGIVSGQEEALRCWRKHVQVRY